ncbi:MAG: acetaldehyde dehydrogenase (acetylating), partial [Oscillospiraceae bacterium]|nr:acetaldehyde dehydrogenase (acetylating) [Oscillospiraceae bacterium]
MELDKDLKSRQEVRNLAREAESAFQELGKMKQEDLDRIVLAIRDCALRYGEQWGAMAAAETGFGNPKDKAEKNRFAAQRVYEAIKNQKTVGLLKEEPGLWEIGIPVGMIAGIVPSTNPTSTVIYKAMIALKAGSPIVFSPHPGAVRCTCETARRLAEAAEAAGCPKGAIGCISTPTMEAVTELMHHPHTRLILATGGGAMVKAAYSSGKPAIGVGAGNGPAYIHRSADVPKAVGDIIRSKTFDNGTICASEQSVIVESCCEERVKEEFRRQGAYFLNKEEAGRLAGILLRPNGTMNPKVVGRTAYEVAAMANVSVPKDTTVLVARETEAGPTRPYSREKLCPILALFVERNEDTILERAVEVLLGEGAGHTFSIHATDEAVIRRFAERIPVSRFLVNTPSSLGGIGATTKLFPALTLGCGAVGGSSSSNNIGPLDLINIRRVAWGTEGWDSGASPCHRNVRTDRTHWSSGSCPGAQRNSTGEDDSSVDSEVSSVVSWVWTSPAGSGSPSAWAGV